VIGLTQRAATKKLAAAHCTKGRVSRKFSTKRRKGRVLAQNPEPKFILDAGSKINLTISKGKKPSKRRSR